MGNCCKLLDQSNNKIKWDDIDEKSSEMLSFKGDEVECKVVSVYDGDTIKVVFPLGGHMYKWNCRISGVDTPELRTRCKLEKQKGYEVRDKLREKILGKVIKIKCDDFDKYGRLLITPIVGEENICQWLVKNEYAFEYDGGTKKSWKTFLENKS